MVRLKHRYLLVHVLYPEESKPRKGQQQTAPLPNFVQFHQPTSDELTPQLLARLIKDQIALLFGDYGAGVTAVKYLSPATSTAIIRCPRAHYRLVWAALTFTTELPKIKQVPPRPCVFQVVRVSGTIKKSEEEAIRRAKAAILRAKRETTEGTMDGLQAILSSQAGSAKSKKQDLGVEDVGIGDVGGGIIDLDDDDDVESDSEG